MGNIFKMFKPINATELIRLVEGAKTVSIISLMSHILKLFLNIIHGRIRKKRYQRLSSNQFGYKENLIYITDQYRNIEKRRRTLSETQEKTLSLLKNIIIGERRQKV